MELRHLRYFVAVADELSFRRAAERLHVSQPPLSTQIKALEAELGVRLFERLNRGIKLTPEGSVFLTHARTALAAADTARQSAQDAGKGMLGTLRIGVMLPIMTVRLARGFLRFRQSYPAIQLSVQELTTAEQVQRLQNDQLDVGIMRPPLGSTGLESRFIEEASLVLAVPKGHRFANQRQISWADFRDEPMVMLQSHLQFGLYNEFLHECAKNGAMPSMGYYASNADTVFWLVSAGLGFTLLAEIGMKHPGAVFCKPPAGLSAARVMLVWKQSNRSPALANFLENF